MTKSEKEHQRRVREIGCMTQGLVAKQAERAALLRIVVKRPRGHK